MQSFLRDGGNVARLKGLNLNIRILQTSGIEACFPI